MMGSYLFLHDKTPIPVLGLGTSKPNKPGEVENAVKIAIDHGYRHFEAAWIYQNEFEIGQGINAKIQEGVVRREELFVSTKLWNNFHARKKVSEMLRQSLGLLGLNYVDLFLIHWPMGFREDGPIAALHDPAAQVPGGNYSDVDYLETWSGMEDCVHLGLAKSIGLCNFNEFQIERILKRCKIPPAVNQVEVHLQFNQKKLIEFCTERNIVVIGSFPWGKNDMEGGVYGFPEPTVIEPKVHALTRKYRKTPGQIVLNYLISKGICVVPKSITKVRIEEYINIFNFRLTTEETQFLNTCNEDKRLNIIHLFSDHKYYPFKDNPQ